MPSDTLVNGGSTAAPVGWTVYAFSQSDVGQEDPQVYRLVPTSPSAPSGSGPPTATRRPTTTSRRSRATTRRASRSWAAGRRASSSRRTSPPPRSSTTCPPATPSNCRYRTTSSVSRARPAGQHVQPGVPALPARLGEDPDRRRRGRGQLRRGERRVQRRPEVRLQRQRGVRRLHHRRLQPVPAGEVPGVHGRRLEVPVRHDRRQPAARRRAGRRPGAQLQLPRPTCGPTAGTSTR